MPVEVWFQDEMRVGQKNKLTYRWARKGSLAPSQVAVEGQHHGCAASTSLTLLVRAKTL